MLCQKCGAEIDTRMRRPDGFVQCPNCGTVYRQKNAGSASASKSNMDTPRRATNKTKQYSEHTSKRTKEVKNQATKRRAWKLGAISLVVVCLAAFILYGLLRGNINPFVRYSKLIPSQDYALLPDSSRIVITQDTGIMSEVGTESTLIMNASNGMSFAFRQRLCNDGRGVAWYNIAINDTQNGWVSSEYATFMYGDASAISSNYQAGTVLSDFHVKEEEMLHLLAGKNNRLVFTVKATPDTNPVYLGRVGREDIVGRMRDDGQGEDEVANDGIYTYEYNINAASYGYQLFFAECAGETSNYEKVCFYEGITTQNYASATALSDSVNEREAPFLNTNGYVNDADADDTIEAVGEYATELYRDGRISEYTISENSVSYRDSVTGTVYVYFPSTEENLSSGNSYKVVVSQPYANAPTEETPLDPSTFTEGSQFLHDSLGFSTTSFQDNNVYPELFDNLRSNQILLWFGHGNFCTFLSNPPFSHVNSPIIATGIKDETGYHLNHEMDFLCGRLCVSTGDKRILITSRYIDAHCGNLSGSFIWFNSCLSGHNSTLADSFLNKGATAVLGYSETVHVAYADTLFYETMHYMTEINTQTGDYYSFGEAIDLVTSECGSNDAIYYETIFYPYWIEHAEQSPTAADFCRRIGPKRNDKKPSAPVIFGDRNYRFTSTSEGTVGNILNRTPIPTLSTVTRIPSPTLASSMASGSFNIIGTWKSVGSWGFGQAQPGAVVAFDGTHCNYYSPYDTYTCYQSEGQWKLDITSFIFGQNLSFTIDVVDNNNIQITYAGKATELQRMSQTGDVSGNPISNSEDYAVPQEQEWIEQPDTGIETTALPTAIPTEIPTEMPTVVPTTVPTTAPTTVPLTELSDDLEYRVEITGDKVNVRTSPDTGSSIIKPGNKGDLFTLIDQSIGADGTVWFNIGNRAGQTGWVSSQFAKIIIATKATPTPVPTETFYDDDFSQVFMDDSMADENDGYMGIMEIVDCDSWVSLRSKPDKDSSRLAKVPLGALVETWAYNSEFYKCVYEGKTGYILVQYIGQPDVEEQVENGTWESDFYVYATAGGRYYHIDSSCSGMKNASRYLLSDMYNQEKPACPVCFPEADTVVYGEPGNPYYHSYSGCSDMSDPMEDTLVGAILVGLKKCPICW